MAVDGITEQALVHHQHIAAEVLRPLLDQHRRHVHVPIEDHDAIPVHAGQQVLRHIRQGGRKATAGSGLCAPGIQRCHVAVQVGVVEHREDQLGALGIGLPRGLEFLERLALRERHIVAAQVLLEAAGRGSLDTFSDLIELLLIRRVQYAVVGAQAGIALATEPVELGVHIGRAAVA